MGKGMPMKVVQSVSVSELEKMSENMYDGLVKAVVDVRQGVVVVDAPMHVDEEALLLEMGSSQRDLWGINLYPDCYGSEDFIEFDSMINIRPGQGNRSRGVDDEETRAQIAALIERVVHE